MQRVYNCVGISYVAKQEGIGNKVEAGGQRDKDRTGPNGDVLGFQVPMHDACRVDISATEGNRKERWVGMREEGKEEGFFCLKGLGEGGRGGAGLGLPG